MRVYSIFSIPISTLDNLEKIKSHVEGLTVLEIEHRAVNFKGAFKKFAAASSFLDRVKLFSSRSCVLREIVNWKGDHIRKGRVMERWDGKNNLLSCSLDYCK